MKHPLEHRSDFLFVGIPADDVSGIWLDILWKFILRTKKDDRVSEFLIRFTNP
jgi:hypothetical protein